uniref:Transmembrane protein 254 n=1 Tax=Sphenodon punctatus TaxID=8508 RepID=A0A8D0L9H1_SPHPU
MAATAASTHAGSSSAASTYFRRTSPFWMAVIAAAMAYYTWVVISPERVPYDRLGQFGRFTKYLVDHHYKFPETCINYHQGWLASCLFSPLEITLSLFSYCRTKGITDSSTQQRWFIQTFLFGIASLSHLLAYRTQLKKQR